MPVSDYEISSNLACMADLHSLMYNSIFFDAEVNVINGFATSDTKKNIWRDHRKITLVISSQLNTIC